MTCALLRLPTGLAAAIADRGRALWQRLVPGASTANVALQQLFECERAYREIIDNSPQGLVIVDDGGRVLMANPAAARLFGYAGPEEVLALATIDTLLDPTERGRVLPDRLAGDAGEVPPVGSDLRVHRRDGAAIWCEVHGHRMVWSGRPVVELVLVDATARREADAALDAARIAADAANRAKSEFLAKVSHEIRTPMNAVVGLSHLALAASGESADRNRLRQINCAAKALLGTIDDILDFAGVEAGRIEIGRVEFALEDVLDTLRVRLGAAAEQRAVTLAFTIGQDVPPRLIGDPARLGQVLRHLLSNAIKFSERDVVAVTVAIAAHNRLGANLRFSVEDRGIGLSVAQQERLFEPFWQADGSSLRRPGGTGLGLVVCKRLVEAMGGQITVESVLGRGSTFAFNLNFDLPAAALRAAVARTGRLAGLRILVVEDNVVNQAVAEGILVFEGAAVTLAANGRIAVDLLRNTAFDAVLMDLQMPVMDGYSATRAIRGELGLKRLPIIAVTAHALAGERRRCREAGMNDHLSKPVDPKRLVDTVRNEIGAAQAGLPPAGWPQMEVVPAGGAAEKPGLPGIDMADALGRLGGNRALLERVYLDFCRQYVGAAGEIDRLVTVGAVAEAAALAHAVKGVAGNIGAIRIFAAAKTLETDLLAGGGRETLAALTAALAELPRREQPASAIAAAPAPVLPSRVDRDALGRAIGHLRDLLNVRDLEAEESLAVLGRLCPDGLAREPLAGLAVAIDALDFEAALGHLNRVEATALGVAPG
jgi:PAS domain S-box-containing protein